MKYAKRVIDTEVWDSKFFDEDFSPEDKYFYLYLLSNTHTTQLGIYKISKKKIAAEMGYSVDSISVLVDRFQNKYELIKYNEETNEIAIKNYLKHSVVRGGKPVLDCLIQDEKKINDKSLLHFAIRSLVNDTEITETIKEFISLYINDNDNDNVVTYHDTYHESYDESSEDNEQLEKDFKLIYDHYPKKGTKSTAFASYKRWVQKTGRQVGNKRIKLTNRQIWAAVDNYVKEQEKMNKDLQYYKNFVTLMNQITDWVEEE